MAVIQNVPLKGLLLAGAIGFIGLTGMAFDHVARAAQQGKDEIIWDDAPNSAPPSVARPAPGPRPEGDSPNSAPIRDNFSHPAAKASDSGPRKGDITWNQGEGKTPTATVTRPNSATPGPCREFQQRVMIEGRPQQVHGRACRQTDGSWRIVN